MKNLITAVLIFGAPGISPAQPAGAPGDAQERAVPGKTHAVVKGDTLWGLAARYYADPFKWGAIYKANPGLVKDPDRIYPGWELLIPGTPGEPAPAPQPSPAAQEAPAAEALPAPAPAAEAGEEPAPEEARAIPEAEIEKNTRGEEESLVYDRTDLSLEMPEDLKEWSDNVLVMPGNWRGDGTITGKEDEYGYSDSLTEVTDIVVLKLAAGISVAPGDLLKAYMLGAEVFDKSGGKLGKEVSPTGVVKVLTVKGRTARARIVRANSSVDSGQVVKKLHSAAKPI